jgi:Fic family protein
MLARSYRAHLDSQLNKCRRVVLKPVILFDDLEDERAIKFSSTIFASVVEKFALGPLPELAVIDSDCLNEVWVGENPENEKSVSNTINVSDLVIENGTKPEYLTNDQWREIKNIDNAMKFLFLSATCPSPDPTPFSEMLVQNVHKIVGADGEIEDAGTYRAVDVRPNGVSIQYCQHEKISTQMAVLLEFVNEELRKVVAGVVTRTTIDIACVFFAEILHIHPFRDGNGRVARLLVSRLLMRFTVVPIVLFDATSRDLYLDSLTAAQTSGDFTLLIKNVLRSVSLTASKVHYIIG